MGYLLLIIFFILGSVIGSFVNAAVYRIRHQLPLVKARSHCPHCKHQLSTFDLIPIFSFIKLGGKCSYCAKTISPQYPTVELMTAILFAASFAYDIGLTRVSNNYLDFISLATQLIFITILMIIFWYDLKFMEIPNRVVLIGIVTALALDLVQVSTSMLQFKQVTSKLPIGTYLISQTNFLQTHFLELVTPYLYGAFAGLVLATVFFIIVWITKERAMGGGDVKLAVMLGLMLPWPYIVPSLYLGFLTGSLVGIGLIIFQRGKMHTLIPLAPFLITGVFAAMFFGPQLVQWMITLKPF